jgi:hypothetical protein
LGGACIRKENLSVYNNTYINVEILKERKDLGDEMVDGRAVFNHSSLKYIEGLWNALVWLRTVKSGW